jgi:N-acetyl-gamma-glutamyl-phosphate reductase
LIKCAIVGATGYAGEVLTELLLKHPNVKIEALYAKIEKSLPISELFPRFHERLNILCNPLNINELNKKADLIFLALPHKISMEIVPDILKRGKKIIDLSADYRLKNFKKYKQYYHADHLDKEHIKEAVYGLPELYRKEIKSSRLIANPGCYPTAAILGLAPLFAKDNLIESDSIIIDAKSGFTGAGRNPIPHFIFSEVNESIKPYKVNIHQHMPEIEQQLGFMSKEEIQITFVPHLIPVDRGIISTMYVNLRRALDMEDLFKLYKEFYKNERFIRLLKENRLPNTKDVVGTNFCDISLNLDAKKKRLIVISAIDNLLKGASGQAVQNMNIMFGFEETTALK